MKTTTRLRRLLLSTLALFAASLILPALSTKSEAASRENQLLNSARRGVGNVTNATKRASKKKRKAGDDDGIVENVTLPKWFVELSPNLIKLNNAYLDKFRGASIAAGWRIDDEDKIQIEIGCDTGSYNQPFTYERLFVVPGTGANPSGITLGVLDSASGSIIANKAYTSNYVNLTGQAAAKARMIPVLFSYSYCIGLANSRRFELRLTPAIGVFAMSSTWSLGDATGTFVPLSNSAVNKPDPGTTTMKVGMPGYSGSDSMKFAFTVGAGAGFTWNITERLYADISYRYFWVNHVKNVMGGNSPALGQYIVLPATPPAENGGITSYGQNAWNGAKSWNSMNVHCYALSLGWKF